MIQSGIGWPLTMPSDLSACDAGGLGSRREMPPPSEVPANKSEALLASWVVPPNGDVEAPLALFRANVRTPVARFGSDRLSVIGRTNCLSLGKKSGIGSPFCRGRSIRSFVSGSSRRMRSLASLSCAAFLTWSIVCLIKSMTDCMIMPGSSAKLLGGNDTVSDFLQISHRTFSVSKLNWLSWSCIKIGSRPVQVVIEHVVRASHDFGPVRLSYRYGSGIERRQRFAFDSGHRKRSILSVYQR